MSDYDYSNFKEEQPVDSVLSQIAAKALEQKQTEAEVARLQEELQKAQDKLKDISEFQLPQLMDSIEMTKFTLKDGSEISVQEKIRASIPAAFEKEAFGWLAENKHDHLIKRQFTIEFSRDQEEWAKKFQKELSEREDPLNYKCKRSVHASTLASFVKEQLEEGVALPLDYFGVYRQRFTKIVD
jgi:CHAT domain-containing protein